MFNKSLSSIKATLCLTMIIMGLFPASYGEMNSATAVIFEDDFSNLSKWSNVDGGAMYHVNVDQQVPHAPYMKMINGLVRTDLPFSLTQSFELKAKVKHTSYERNIWIGLFDATGKKGYTAYWDSSSSNNCGGNGFVNIRKHDRTSELLDQSQIGVAISSNATTSHNVLSSEFAELALKWDRHSGTLTLSMDGSVLAQTTDTAFSSFSRIYLKANDWCYFDDVALRTGRDSEWVTVNEMFNQESLGEGATPGSVSLTSPWQILSGSVLETQDSHERAVKTVGDGARAERSLPNHGSITDYPKVAISYDIRRINSYGNSGGVYLVDDNGQGIGFITELASDSHNYTTLKVVSTTNAGTSFSVIGQRWYNVTGTQYHNVCFVWDRSNQEIKAIIDGKQTKSITTVSTDINNYSRLIIQNAYANNIRFDNLCFIRIPNNHINVLDYGAVADGGSEQPTDNAVAFKSAIAASVNTGMPVFVPSGDYAYSKVLTLNGVKMIGCGATSRLISLDENNSTIKLTGSSPVIVGCNIQGIATGRITLPEGNGIWVFQATDFIVSANRVNNVSCAGIFIHDQCINGVVCGNIVNGSKADGIHHTGYSRHIQTVCNAVFFPGDDQIAVVSYAPSRPRCHDIEVMRNYCNGQVWGRGITIVGGGQITYAYNDVNNTHHAGIYLNSESSYNTYGWDNISIVGNVVRNSSLDPSAGHAAIFITSRSEYPSSNITVFDNRSYLANNKGLFLGSYIDNIQIDNNLFNSCSHIGAHLIAPSNVTLSNNEFTNIGLYGMMLESGCSGNLNIDSNLFTNINTQNTASYIDVILVLVNSATSLNITNNHYDNPGGYIIERYIENHLPAYKSTLINNTTSTSAPVWQAP